MATKRTYLDYNGLTLYHNNIKSYVDTSITRINNDLSTKIATTNASLGLPSTQAPGHVATGVYAYVDTKKADTDSALKKLRDVIGLDTNYDSSKIAKRNIIDYLKLYDTSFNASIYNLSTYASQLSQRIGYPADIADGGIGTGVYSALEYVESVITNAVTGLRIKIGLDEDLNHPNLSGGTVMEYITSLHGLGIGYGMTEDITDVVTIGTDGYYFKNPKGEYVMAIKDDGIHVKDDLIVGDFEVNI